MSRRLVHWFSGMLWCVSTMSAAVGGSAARDFESFLSRFRGALAKQDVATVADMTRLPFLFGGEALERASFKRIVPDLFDTSVRDCFEHAEARSEDDARVVFCGPYAFYFRVQPDGQYRLETFGADGEGAP